MSLSLVLDGCTTTQCTNGECETQDDGAAFCDCPGGFMGDLCAGKEYFCNFCQI